MFLILRYEEWLVGDVPFYLKFWAKVTNPFKNGDFTLVIPQLIHNLIICYDAAHYHNITL